MKVLMLAVLWLTACSARPPVRSPYADIRDPLALVRLTLEDLPLAGIARERLLQISNWGLYEEPVDLQPALPAFTVALRSRLPFIQRRALHLLREIAATWTYGFEIDFNSHLRPSTYATPFVEPLLPDIIALIEEGSPFMRLEAIQSSLTFAHLLIVMERRSSALEAALRAAQSDPDDAVAAYATHTVQAMDELIRQPRCVRQ